MQKGISIRLAAAIIAIFGTLAVATIVISLQYFFSSRIATDIVSSYAVILSEHIKDSIVELEQDSSEMVELLSHNRSMVIEDHVVPEVVDPLFIDILKKNNSLYALHIGLESGEFYAIVNLEADSVIRNKMGATLKDRFIKILIEGNGEDSIVTTLFLDNDMNVTRKTANPSNYKSTIRPWFLNANDSAASVSKPYVFQFLKSTGRTASMKISGTNHVIAVDMALSDISGSLPQVVTEAEGVMKDSHIFLHDLEGVVITSNARMASEHEVTRKITPLTLTEQEQAYIESLATLRISNDMSWGPFNYSISGEPSGYIVEKTEMLAESLGLTIQYFNGFSWDELTQHFRDDNIEVLAPIYKSDSNQTWGLFSEPIIKTEVALATLNSSPDYYSLEGLKGKVIAVPSGWTLWYELKENYPEIKLLAVESITAALQAVMEGRADATIDAEAVLQYNLHAYHLSDIKISQYIDIKGDFDGNLHYLVHPEHKQLLDLFNRALKQFTAEDNRYLERKWLNNATRQVSAQTFSGTVPYNELLTIAKDESKHHKLQRQIIDDQDKFIFISSLPNIQDQFISIVLSSDEVLADSRNEVYISIAITSAIVLLLLPFCYFLANPLVRPIRQLALKSAAIMQRQYSQASRQTSTIKEFDELDESLVNMSHAIARHELQQQELMDSFVKLIAQSIDDKSPYTGEHCHRVPVLGLMLADAACKDQSDYFKDFDFADSERRREFKMAAWLHDCGKITTPEHVVDKGSKLETCYNRIHEIRTRFEVVWRDLEIHYYQELRKHPAQESKLQQEKTQAQQQLINDFAFVAKCNVGSEGIEKEDVDRLYQIGERKWTRHFDDQLGLSPLEERRLKRRSAELPVTENLIDDKIEHKIEWEVAPSGESEYGITLQPPELQNNEGELYNLSIIRGTLNNEERYRVQGHIVSTIKMLESLPFPPELANVPKYASTHHETLKGTGYPRGLSAEDLTIEERILVLSDIYEALTAGDRPYKKAKPLSVALGIMRDMVLDDRIDKHVFNLFLRSGIYLSYAEQHVNEEQLDDVRVEDYLV